MALSHRIVPHGHRGKRRSEDAGDVPAFLKRNIEPAELQFHPLSELFPLMEGEEFQALVNDIKENGQSEVIVTLDGAILDGRNRYRACRELGIEPKTVEWSGVGSPQAFVVSHNLHRRHLNESQRALIAAQLATGKHGGSRTKSGIPDLKLRETAELLNVNKDTVTDARLVLREGTEEEIEAAKSGEARVTTLAKQIRKKVPVVERTATRVNPRAADIDIKRAKGKLWSLFRDALNNLNNLPLPADVVRAVRMFDRAGLTDAKLLPAINWLTGFSDAWTSPDTQADPRRKDKPARETEESTAA